MILVTVGTHEDPFDRLVRAADDLAHHVAEPVVVQRGYSHHPAPACEVFDILPPAAFDRYVREARVVVCHGGLATVDQILARGKTPIVVPRRPERGEHVDDDQVRFAHHSRDRVLVCEDPGELLEWVLNFEPRAAALPVQPGQSAVVGWSEADPHVLSARFARVIDGIRPTGGLRRRLLRATLQAIPRWRPRHSTDLPNR